MLRDDHTPGQRDGERRPSPKRRIQPMPVDNDSPANKKKKKRIAPMLVADVDGDRSSSSSSPATKQDKTKKIAPMPVADLEDEDSSPSPAASTATKFGDFEVKLSDELSIDFAGEVEQQRMRARVVFCRRKATRRRSDANLERSLRGPALLLQQGRVLPASGSATVEPTSGTRWLKSPRVALRRYLLLCHLGVRVRLFSWTNRWTTTVLCVCCAVLQRDKWIRLPSAGWIKNLLQELTDEQQLEVSLLQKQLHMKDLSTSKCPALLHAASSNVVHSHRWPRR